MTLEEIASKHGTLKVQHGFMPIYERMLSHLKDEPISLLEIGVHEGASLATWREYFNHGEILGVDIVITDKAKKIEGVITIEGNITSQEIIDQIDCYTFDIIIDDGSHIQSEVISSFNSLWDSVRPGGWYIVEDLFASYDTTWNPEGHPFLDHIQSRLKNILIGGDSIQEIHWFGRNDINGILFLRKRYEDFRIQPLSEFQV